MIRQAHTYLVGAVSGTALVAAAVVTFVLLVSAQAFRDWPLAALPDLGGGDEVSSVAGNQPAAGAASGGGAASAGGAGTGGGAKAPGRQSARQPGDVAGSPLSGSPAAESPGADAPTANSPGSAPTPAGSAPASSTPSKAPGSGAGGSAGGGGQTSGGGSDSSTSGQVTGTVNDTVSGVDKATGGALGDSGVTTVTEEVVNGVAGPESTVGKTVDKVADVVGGLLPGDK